MFGYVRYISKQLRFFHTQNYKIIIFDVKLRLIHSICKTTNLLFCLPYLQEVLSILYNEYSMDNTSWTGSRNMFTMLKFNQVCVFFKTIASYGDLNL